MVSVRATDAHRRKFVANICDVFAHILANDFDPAYVVCDLVRDGIGMDPDPGAGAGQYS